jgi:hypothetical protein
MTGPRAAEPVIERTSNDPSAIYLLAKLADCHGIDVGALWEPEAPRGLRRQMN